MEMKLLKTTIEGVNPETNEEFKHTIESEAVATVSVTKGAEGVEVTSMIMGGLTARTSTALVRALAGMCNDIIKKLDPISAMILMHELMSDEGGEEDVVAGTGSESEGTSQQ